MVEKFLGPFVVPSWSMRKAPSNELHSDLLQNKRMFFEVAASVGLGESETDDFLIHYSFGDLNGSPKSNE